MQVHAWFQLKLFCKMHTVHAPNFKHKMRSEFCITSLEASLLSAYDTIPPSHQIAYLFAQNVTKLLCFGKRIVKTLPCLYLLRILTQETNLNCKAICTGAHHFLEDYMYAQRRLEPACAFAQSNQSLRCPYENVLELWLFNAMPCEDSDQTARMRIRAV